MTTQEAFENFHNACIDFGKVIMKTIEDELHLETLVKLWSEDMQQYTGQWWWEDLK